MDFEIPLKLIAFFPPRNYGNFGNSAVIIYTTKPSPSEASLQKRTSSGNISCIPGSFPAKGQLVPSQFSRADTPVLTPIPAHAVLLGAALGVQCTQP